MTGRELGRAALELVHELEVPVFPLRPRGKEPATIHGFYEASRDRSRIARWWRLADYNIGMPTGHVSGIVVIDIDDDKGGDAAALPALPVTRTVKTGNGMHYYFRAPRLELRSRVGVLPGIDVRADGGYVVVPPSVHPSGTRYAWCERSLVAQLPEALVAHLAQRAAPAPPVVATPEIERDLRIARAKAYVNAMPAAVSGRRGHDTTFRVALVLVRGFSLSGDDALKLLEEYNARCDPPWSERELLHKLSDAQRSRLLAGYLL